jgi:hypothetical protein
MPIAGSGLTDKNTRLRFLVICFCGIVAFAAILYWREQAIFTQDYVDLSRPEANQRKAREINKENKLGNPNLQKELQN